MKITFITLYPAYSIEIIIMWHIYTDTLIHNTLLWFPFRFRFHKYFNKLLFDNSGQNRTNGEQRHKTMSIIEYCAWLDTFCFVFSRTFFSSFLYYISLYISLPLPKLDPHYTTLVNLPTDWLVRISSDVDEEEKCISATKLVNCIL